MLCFQLLRLSRRPWCQVPHNMNLVEHLYPRLFFEAQSVKQAQRWFVVKFDLGAHGVNPELAVDGLHEQLYRFRREPTASMPPLSHHHVNLCCALAKA